MFQLYESELRCQKQKACAQKLFHQSVLFIYNRLDPWSSALYFFGHQFMSLFATDAAVIDAGMQRIKIMAFSYCVSAFMDCTIAASRGLGKTVIPTIIIILGSCVFRIVWIYTIFAWIHTIPALFLLYLFSWIITSIAEIIYFIIIYRKL